jgi:HK97 family phage major capsid protein
MKHMSGNQYALTEAERAALAKGFDGYSPEERAMTGGTGASGGFFVPVYVDPTMIITGAGATSPFRRISTVKQIGPAFGGWYGATVAQVSANWTAENAATSDAGFTVTQPNIPVYLATAFVGVSFNGYEDIQDLAMDVVAAIADAKVNLETVAYVTGTGSSQPKGVVTAVGAVTASRVALTSSTAGVLNFADIGKLHGALPARFRNPSTQGGDGRAWIGNINVLDTLRTLVAGQNSANSLWSDPTGALPPNLYGDPIYEASAMTSTVTTGNDMLLYGDFRRYYIIDRIGLTTEFVPNLFDTTSGRPSATRGWLAHWRTGADAVDTAAFRDLRS